MTKLEEKLIELGYEKSNCSTLYYRYIQIGCFYGYLLKIFLKENNKKIKSRYIHFGSHEMNFEIIDKLCKEMQKDLEILKGVENE